MPDEAQASLRAALAAQISDAQTALVSQLADLQQAVRAGVDSGAYAEVSNQLASLKSLSLNLATASGASLQQLRAEVAMTVAASQSIAQQAAAEMKGGASASAAYQQATADLDRRATALRDADQRHNDDTHKVAAQYGVDLKEYDEERRDLERQREDAIARGDKVAERRFDYLLNRNTLNSMAATREGITDPEVRERFDAEVAEQKRNAEAARKLLEEQLELDARERAAQKHMTIEETAVYVDQYKAERLAEADRRASELVTPADRAESVALGAARKAVLSESVPTEAQAAIHTALTPEAREAAKQAMSVARNDFGSALSGFSFNSAPQIALSSAPDAHTSVEVPITKTARAASSQTLA